MNSTTRIDLATVEAAVTRIKNHSDDSDELLQTTMHGLVKFSHDCNILSIKALFDEPDSEILRKAIKIGYGGINAVLKRQPEGRILDDSFQRVIGPVIINYNLIMMRPDAMQSLESQDHQKVVMLNRMIYADSEKFTLFDYLTAAITTIIFIIRLQQRKVLNNNPNIVSNLREEARSYLKKADKTTITTSFGDDSTHVRDYTYKMIYRVTF